MSLAITLTNALSGLMVNQTSLQVTANNVANVNTEGYSRKTVTTESRTLAGVGAGVVISSIDRAVDKFLQGEVRTEATALGEREVRRDFYLQMQALFGNLNDDNSVGATITRFATSLENVATNPDSAVHRLDAVTAGAAAARELNALAQSVQDLRGEADRKIAAAVDDINDQLSFIAELNVKIANNRLAGNPTADLEDQRALAIDTVAEYLPIQYFERSNGYIVVMTRNGQTLVESQATRIGYSASTVMTAERTYLPPGDPGYPGTIAGIIVNPSDPPNPVSDGSRDITLSIGGGRLASLIEMRDTTLVDMADQFDELAAQLRDRVNALHNQGTPYPGSTVMTGTVMLPLGAATPVSATGYVRIGTVDASGNMNVPRLDLDLGTIATVADIVTAINSTAGLNVTAAVDGQGRLVLTSGSGDELVVAQPEPPSALAPSAIGLAGGTRGFSHFFGLNNFFTATPELGGYSSGVINPATRADSAGTLITDDACSRPFWRSPMLTAGTLSDGASSKPLDELPTTASTCLSALK